MKKLLSIMLCMLFATSTNAEALQEHFVIKASISKNKIAGNVVVYNLSNAKLHLPNCEWAEKCTKNCIYKDKRDLEEMFYVPCAVCGGGIYHPMQQ